MAEHVRAQSKELAQLSREAGLVTVAYWLDVVAFEAENQLKDKGDRFYSME
jgi:hypothetical protein